MTTANDAAAQERMRKLITKLEAATEGSRELDAEIAFDCFAKPVGVDDADGGPRGYLWPKDNASWSFGIRFPGKDRAWFSNVRKGREETLVIERDGALVLMNSLRIRPYTDSLDVALTLWETPELNREYPRRGVNLFYAVLPGGKQAWRSIAWEVKDGSSSIVWVGEAHHRSRKISVCIAVLRARLVSPNPEDTKEEG